jgi:adenylate kinase family enzyme
MKIAICGQMASGKTTLANRLCEEENYTRLSLAGMVKEVAYTLFNMNPQNKDRKLLQQIGMKMREIRPMVWIDYVIEESKGYECVVVDDVRFINEVKQFKENGWILVKLEITDEIQKSRLQKTYDDWESHWNNRDDPSEAEVDKIPIEWFDLVISPNDGDVFEKIYSLSSA